MSAIIYLLTNTINGKQYIGQTIVGLNKRWKRHCFDARKGHTYLISQAIRKYGPEAFTRKILEYTTIENVNNREIYWIAKLKTLEHGYNMTEGGRGAQGWKANEEQRAKLSESHKGKIFSQEHRKKLSANAKLRVGEKHPMYGKKHSPETKAKLQKAALGRKATEETKAKMREAHFGENNYMYGRKHSNEVKEKCRAAAKLQARMKRIQAPPITINTE